MTESPRLSDQYRMASPWPLFVALGLPIAEIGILFGLFPVAVGGLVLFCGSIAGLLQEADYVATPWPALVALAALLLAGGTALVVTDSQFVTRGYAIVAAGVILLVGGLAGIGFVPSHQSGANR